MRGGFLCTVNFYIIIQAALNGSFDNNLAATVGIAVVQLYLCLSGVSLYLGNSGEASYDQE